MARTSETALVRRLQTELAKVQEENYGLVEKVRVADRRATTAEDQQKRTEREAHNLNEDLIQEKSEVRYQTGINEGMKEVLNTLRSIAESLGRSRKLLKAVATAVADSDD
jgi:vacuolar-type H+-ATPase subunit I/STV1